MTGASAVVERGKKNRQEYRRLDPCTFVIFGGSGDLAKRKLLPAFYNLESLGLLPDKFNILCVARRDLTDDVYRAEIHQALDEFLPDDVDEKTWRRMAKRLHYVSNDLRGEGGFGNVRQRLSDLSRKNAIPESAIFDLALSPEFFADLIRNLAKADLGGRGTNHNEWKRIMVEKPFGHDLRSARELNTLLARTWRESEIYRLDHYLGKDMVHNILILRFANAIFEPLWCNRYVDHVEITANETVGIERRASYYEGAGALRDMVQSHLLQLVSLVAMEPPSSFSPEHVRDGKSAVLSSLRPLTPEEIDGQVVRGQYGVGTVDGKRVPGYRHEPGVSPDSNVETCAALRLFVDTDRWEGVPFYLRTGKRLARKTTEVVVHFKPVTRRFFEAHPTTLCPNRLLIHIGPHEGLSLEIHVKPPMTKESLCVGEFDFGYRSTFGGRPTEDYEMLFLDCLAGDQTLFARRDAVEAEWAFITPILERWSAVEPPAFPNYAAGSEGPEEVRKLPERDGHSWA